MRAAEVDGRIPVSLGYQGNQPAVAGVTMTGPHTGYLSAESARTFGDAVARQFVADHRKSGPKPMASPTFTSGAKLSLAGATTPAPKPMYVMKTLTLKASDIDGAPANSATALVQNLDNGNRFEEIDPFFDGEARESVPVGNYAATIVYFDVNTDGDVTGLRVVTRPQFAVTEDATMSFAATEATSEVTMRTPRPAELQEGGFVLDRGGAAGYGSYTDVAVAPGGPIWVSPTTTPVTIGTMHSYPYRRLTSPAGRGEPYTYSLQYLSTGVIPQQVYTASSANTATIDASYYSDIDSTGFQGRTAFYPFELNYFVFHGFGNPLSMPTRRLEYVSAGNSIAWAAFASTNVWTDPRFPGFPMSGGGQGGSARRYTPGEKVTEAWNEFPLSTRAPVNLAGSQTNGQFEPGVVRSGDTETFNLSPFSDNETGHVGWLDIGNHRDPESETYELDQDGSKIADGPVIAKTAQIPDATVKAAVSTLHLTIDAARSGPDYKLSTGNHSEWTWQSHHQEGTLPPGYGCGFEFVSPTNCSVEPLMTAQTVVRGMSLHGTVPAGLQTMDLTLSHLQLTPQSPIPSAKVEFSTDDGTTWHQARTVRVGNGHYLAVFTAPTGFVSLRVSGTDTVGGSIIQTVNHAYQTV
ncbi:hypothetical protein [Fodinicola feengrottensis]|uniref:hypothetical protein n=1 Tax=Fodinicola feengrottensis TaxID=435914 RepID=UPI0031DC90FF